MIKLYKGQRTNYLLRVKLSDCKTLIAPAHCMMFWFYIQLPHGRWVDFDIRQLQESQLQGKAPQEWFRLIVDHELALIKEFAGKTEKEQMQVIAEKISHLPIDYFMPRKQAVL